LPKWLHSAIRPSAIAELPFDPSMPMKARRVIVAGGIFPYWLGSLSFTLRDTIGGALDVTLVAQFIEDRGALNSFPLILGLQGGLIEGRTLTAQPDAAAPHGQSWTLEE
jgi:hypothetical protein